MLLTAISAQYLNAQRICATKDFQQLQQDDPKHAEQLLLIEEHTQEYIRNRSGEEKAASIITIPVVVHVIYQTNAQNISEQRCKQYMVASRRYANRILLSIGRS